MIDRDIAIVGAGIGGLTAALSLHRAGFTPTLYEAAPTLRPLGVGINLLPHAVRELAELGLLDELRALGVEIDRLVYRMDDGQAVWEEPRGMVAGYDWPQIAIHRGVLQTFLFDKVCERIGKDAVRTGMTLSQLERTDNGHRAHFIDTATGQPALTIEPDLLIGADGIHSAVRRHFHPHEGKPRWNGVTLWRSTTIMRADDVTPTMIWAGHRDQKFVAYPISIDRVRNEAVMNWICDLRSAQDGAPPPEDWSSVGDRSDFIARYADWQWDMVDVPAIIERSGPISVYPMMDRDPLSQWNDRGLTLLGDAAHPMYPIGSNGATQAIIDGRVLAFYLSRHDDIDSAIAAYQDHRLPATSAIVMANRGQGPDLVLDIARERAGTTMSLDDAFPDGERAEIAARYKSLAGFSPKDLNERASFSPASPLPPHAG